MRRTVQRLTSATFAALMLVCLCMLASCGVVDSITGSATGARNGRAAAEKDIAARQPALLFLGRPAPERDVIDPKSGLPRWSAGCELTDERLAYVDAYNDTMNEALGDGRLNGLTLSHTLTTHAAVAARFANETPISIVLNGDAVDAPGGRFTIRYRPYQAEHPDGTRFLYVTDNDSGNEYRTENPSEDIVPLLFSEDTGTMFVREEHLSRYAVIELRRGITTQFLPDPGSR